jgi:glycosyltransferase involved in cell wall biosynthesis
LDIETDHRQLTVVFLQYDREKYEGALETLMALLCGLDNVSFRLIVVDNGEPGDWRHQISERVTHIGGDNSAWEFSAFDKGLAFARKNGFKQDLFAFVTDAYAAYGSDFLDLINEDIIEATLDWNACVGWVDAYPEEVELYGHRYREWLRTSFILVPHGIIDSLEPFAFPIDEKKVFGRQKNQKFADGSPVGDQLQKFLSDWLLDEPGVEKTLSTKWHSNFKLTDKNESFFRQKASAIIREQMLSIRLREANIPVYDFRLFSRLEKHYANQKFWRDNPGTNWQWLEGLQIELPNISMDEVKHYIDFAEMPERISCGDDVHLAVKGWAMAPLHIREVQVMFSGGGSFAAPCDMDRSDVALDHPSLAGGREAPCGFSFHAPLKDLAPGRHEVTLQIGDTGHSLHLGNINVLPSLRFSPSRVFFPEWCTTDIATVVAVEGEVLCTSPLSHVSMSLDGVVVPDSATWEFRGRRAGGISSYWVKATGQRIIDADSGRHALQLEFALKEGMKRSWQEGFSMRQGARLGYSVHRWSVGTWSTHTGTARLVLEGVLARVEPGDRLVLLNQGQEIFREDPLADPNSAGDFVPFHIERDVAGLHPGKLELTLALEGREGLQPLEHRSFVVELDEPEIHVDMLEVEITQSFPEVVHTLRSSGWIRNHFLVDSLLLQVDGQRVSGLGLDQLRPDVSKLHGDPLVLRQGFNFAVDIKNFDAGAREVVLLAGQPGGAQGSFRRMVTFDPSPSQIFQVISADIEGLSDKTSGTRFGEFCFKGRLETECGGVIGRLYVDGELVDEVPFNEASNAEFVLRYRPPSAGSYTIRICFVVRGRNCLDTGSVELEFQPIPISKKVEDTWSHFLEHLELSAHLVEDFSPVDLLNRLMADRDTSSRQWVDLLDGIASSFKNPVLDASKRISIAENPSDRPLNVLFCTWETPYSRHGGGVHLMNLLRGLGERHEITLVHTYGDDLQYVDEARPFVNRVVSVPRTHMRPGYCADGLLPKRFYEEYNPELERVIDRELSTGVYDLVDFEWSIMRPLAVRKVPSVLAIHELDYSALLNTLIERASRRRIQVDELGELLRLFYLDVVDLPSAFDALVTLTSEDAEAILRYNGNAKVFVNEAGATLPPSPKKGADRKRPPSDAPEFLLVANYQHPPNALAALFLANKVMPLVRARIPGAKLVLAGPHAPPEIAALESASVSLLGFVDDLAATYRRATAVMVPVFTGTGMRIKTVEALSHGRPFIGNALATRGLKPLGEEAFLVAETAEEFAAAACRIANDDGFAAKLGKAGQNYVKNHLSVSRLVDSRDKLWASLIESGKPGES